MLMPSIFGEDLFDNFMKDFPFFDDNSRKQCRKEAVRPQRQEPDED